MENNYRIDNENNQFNQHDPNNEPMTLGDWIKTFLLLLIPIANIVLMFVWAFGRNVNKSKKTYFQAQLIIMAVALVIYLIIGVSLFRSLSSLNY